MSGCVGCDDRTGRCASLWSGPRCTDRGGWLKDCDPGV